MEKGNTKQWPQYLAALTGKSEQLIITLTSCLFRNCFGVHNLFSLVRVQAIVESVGRIFKYQ